jgi:YbbR domain-containing protein
MRKILNNTWTIIVIMVLWFLWFWIEVETEDTKIKDIQHYGVPHE